MPSTDPLNRIQEANTYYDFRPLVQELGAANNGFVCNLLDGLRVQPSNSAIRDNLKRLLSSVARSQVDKPNLFPPQFRNYAIGLILLGHIVGTRLAYRLKSVHSFLRNWVIYAATGYGKTNMVLHLASQCLPACPCWFLSHNSEHRPLLKLFSKLLGFLRWNHFKFNPLKAPPGVDQKEHIHRVVAHVATTLGLLDASENYLLHSVLAVCEIFGTFKGGPCPSFIDVLNYINSQQTQMRGHAHTYWTAVQNRLQGLVDSMRSALDCETGFIQQFLDNKRSLILELDGIPPKHEALLVNLILNHVLSYYMKKHAGDQRDKLNLIVFIEEAHDLIDPALEQRPEIGGPPLKTIFATQRKTGVATVITQQSPSETAGFVKHHCVNRATSRQVDGHDVSQIQNTLRLSKEQADALPYLKVGEFIVSTSDYPEPILVHVPKFQGPEYVGEEFVLECERETLSQLWWTPRPDIPLQQVDQEKEEITEDVLRYLADVASVPLVTTQERGRRLNLTPASELRRRKKCVELGLVQEMPFDQDRGAPVVLLDILPKGMEALK